MVLVPGDLRNGGAAGLDRRPPRLGDGVWLGRRADARGMDYVLVTSAMALAALPNAVVRLLRGGAVAHLLAGALGVLWLAAVGLYALVYLQLGGRSAGWLVPMVLGVLVVGGMAARPGLRARLQS